MNLNMSNYYDSRYYNGDSVEFGTPNRGYHHTEGYESGTVQRMSPQTDLAVVGKVIEKLKSYSMIAMILAFLTIVSGATTLGVAAKNIGFPVFNFGPLLVGIIFFICGSVGFNASKKARVTDRSVEGLSYIKCGVIAVFAISVATISLSILSAVFAFLSGAVCAGANIQVYSRTNYIRTKLDVSQYCSPNDTANTVLAFIDGGLCLLIFMWSILGTIFFCSYGRYLGIKTKRNGF